MIFLEKCGSSQWSLFFVCFFKKELFHVYLQNQNTIEEICNWNTCTLQASANTTQWNKRDKKRQTILVLLIIRFWHKMDIGVNALNHPNCFITSGPFHKNKNDHGWKSHMILYINQYKRECHHCQYYKWSQICKHMYKGQLKGLKAQYFSLPRI